jgi:hypothetical protein
VLAVEMVQQAALQVRELERRSVWAWSKAMLAGDDLGLALSQIVAKPARVNIRLRGSTIPGGE